MRRIAHLAFSRFAAQLGDRFDQGHETADRAAGLSAGQLAAVGGHRKVAVEVQVTFLDESPRPRPSCRSRGPRSSSSR